MSNIYSQNSVPISKNQGDSYFNNNAKYFNGYKAQDKDAAEIEALKYEAKNASFQPADLAKKTQEAQMYALLNEELTPLQAELAKDPWSYIKYN